MKEALENILTWAGYLGRPIHRLLFYQPGESRKVNWRLLVVVNIVTSVVTTILAIRLLFMFLGIIK